MTNDQDDHDGAPVQNRRRRRLKTPPIGAIKVQRRADPLEKTKATRIHVFSTIAEYSTVPFPSEFIAGWNTKVLRPWSQKWVDVVVARYHETLDTLAVAIDALDLDVRTADLETGPEKGKILAGGESRWLRYGGMNWRQPGRISQR